MMPARSAVHAAAAALATSGFALAVACGIAAAAAGLGHHLGLWSFRTGFSILRWAVYIEAGAAVACLTGAALAAAVASRRHALLGIAGFALAAAVVIPVWNLQRAASQVPRIHDITTDTDNPPQFVELRATRERSPNGAAYGGARIAEQQKAAYPDIQPIFLDAPPDKAFERALAAARRMGWTIAAAEPAEGRIEATATTFWFRFKDDVVIRVAAQGTGSRVDVRSMSRLGRSDLGANAKRIRTYAAELRGSG